MKSLPTVKIILDTRYCGTAIAFLHPRFIFIQKGNINVCEKCFWQEFAYAFCRTFIIDSVANLAGRP